MAIVRTNCNKEILAELTRLNEITNRVLELRATYEKSLKKLGKNISSIQI